MQDTPNLNERPFLFPELPNLPERVAALGHSWGLFLSAGIGFIILGAIAFSWPVGSTLGLTFALGVLFIIDGVIQLIHTIQLRKETGTGWRLIQSIVALAAGFLILRFPAGGVLGVATLMAFYFFVSAVVRGAFAMNIRPHRGWGWSLASAIASFLIGVYIVATLPISALWVPGFLLGIDLVIYGASLVGFSFDLRRVHKTVEEVRDRTTRAPRAA